MLYFGTNFTLVYPQKHNVLSWPLWQVRSHRGITNHGFTPRNRTNELPRQVAIFVELDFESATGKEVRIIYMLLEARCRLDWDIESAQFCFNSTYICANEDGCSFEIKNRATRKGRRYRRRLTIINSV